MKQGEKKYSFYTREGVLSLCFIFIFYANGFGQWKRLSTVPFDIGTVYFEHNIGHPEIGFISSYFKDASNSRDIPAKLFKTTDGGKTWRNVSSPLWLGWITDIYFKDQMTGWFALDYFSNSAVESGGCYSTSDGGETWSFMKATQGRSHSIYYNPSLNLLLANIFYSSSMSRDFGANWQAIPSANHGIGFAFWDSLHGILTQLQSPILFTTDGGLSWNPSSLTEEPWQPLAIQGTSIAFALCEVTKSLWRSDDFGMNWNFVHQFDPTTAISGCIRGESTKLIAQTYQNRMIVSSDSGLAWHSICGSANDIDTRFFYYNDTIIAGDFNGNLFMNVTGKASGPRLQIETDNISRKTNVRVSDFLPVDIFYSTDAYNEKVDSLTFTVNINGALLFARDSLANGWTEKRRIVTDSTVTFILQRTDPSAPQTDSFVIRAYFQGIISKEKTGILALDEINFNKDVTYRDCMISSLSKTDSLFVDIQDQCGDSILREYINKGTLTSFFSITPNPTSGNVRISLKMKEVGNVRVELLNVLGQHVAKVTDGELRAGSHSFDFNTNGIPAGSYFLMVSTPSAREVQRLDVVK
ncbi:MAG: T9SS type A sorting domain-containing protein [bacterium]